MNKQEKKIYIVRRLLEVAETISKERGWRSTPHDVTFLCPGIGDYVDGANGVLVKKLERYNPHPTSRKSVHLQIALCTRQGNVIFGNRN